jgi:hypothetical protein
MHRDVNGIELKFFEMNWKQMIRIETSVTGIMVFFEFLKRILGNAGNFLRFHNYYSTLHGPIPKIFRQIHFGKKTPYPWG